MATQVHEGSVFIDGFFFFFLMCFFFTSVSFAILRRSLQIIWHEKTQQTKNEPKTHITQWKGQDDCEAYLAFFNASVVPTYSYYYDGYRFEYENGENCGAGTQIKIPVLFFVLSENETSKKRQN